ncbi:M20/M25/M40 family metallo-hydrolase [uncultured Ruthenibacterium sp.]|uniref:M20/M25/M40 family metallo-hydrolase n=1 Tax=uncultured Ruthenibacterium sp. TaxID=1905347 RepID=UPI00349E8EF2
MIALILLAVLLIWVAILVVRAAACKPVEPDYGPDPGADINLDKAAEHLAQLVKIPTVSNYDESKVDFSQFQKFREKLKQLYPKVHKLCNPVLCGNTGLLFHWKGASDLEPTVLMAHYDVVPVTEEAWEHPPFCGQVFDGELWGRGTLDTKITLMGILEAAEHLIEQGFVPQNDIWFAFAGDEEVSGHGATDIIAYLKEKGVKPAMVVDEGGAVVEGVFPGVTRPIAVVGIGEKGMMNVELRAVSEGGHASHPTRPSAVGAMSRAVARLEAHPMKAVLTKPVYGLFQTMAPHAPFALRVVLNNLWCFGGLLCLLAEKLGGEVNAMMRTTFAFTMAQGSKQINVMPNQAVAGVNVRLVNVDTPESVKTYMEKVIGDPHVSVCVTHAQSATPYASTDNAHWHKLSAAIAHTWKGCLVSPYLMIACSDSRHYTGFCDDVYKFSAMQLSTAQRGLIHNDNERIPVQEIARTVAFFVRLEQTL